MGGIVLSPIFALVTEELGQRVLSHFIVKSAMANDVDCRIDGAGQLADLHQFFPCLVQAKRTIGSRDDRLLASEVAGGSFLRKC